MRRTTGDRQRRQDLGRSIGGALRDRTERAGTGHHRSHRDRQHRDQTMPHTTKSSRINDSAQHRQQIRPRDTTTRTRVDIAQVVNNGIDRQ